MLSPTTTCMEKLAAAEHLNRHLGRYPVPEPRPVLGLAGMTALAESIDDDEVRGPREKR